MIIGPKQPINYCATSKKVHGCRIWFSSMHFVIRSKIKLTIVSVGGEKLARIKLVRIHFLPSKKTNSLKSKPRSQIITN